jgi:hypothetical protein
MQVAENHAFGGALPPQPSPDSAPSMKILFLFILMLAIMLASYYGSSMPAAQRRPQA